MADTPSAARTIMQRGLWFEEFEVGARYVHRPGRTVTQADNQLFSALTMNPQALHVDEAYAQTQPFGRPLINSMWTLATLIGSSVPQLTQGTLVAQLGLDEVGFPAPLFPGDTLYCDTEIVSARPSASRPGQGIVIMRHTGRNQDDVVVATATRTALVWCRSHEKDET
ncbi:MaoC family dehydratase [Microbacterium sp. Sa4CUA7]|uniref:MaoC family dehydratase n=1 Tax=Microbacterium pullorum TaxID=2762236 RepID=A0ABR8S375_9MICO|nr:MaoC family dehydratase [Microbacterium pullorum]MBD7957936.1 MaoC family dehydratase [Microbacterium pullorum]